MPSIIAPRHIYGDGRISIYYPPKTGSGEKRVWKWILDAARQFHERSRKTFEEFAAFITEWVTPEHCGRYPQRNDIANAWAAATGQRQAFTSVNGSVTGNWPKPDVALTEQEAERFLAVSVEWLKSRPGNRAAEFAPDRLYYPVTSLERLPRLMSKVDLQFIVPNPMTGYTGKVKDMKTGKIYPSSRCRDNACRDWRYQVVEFDFKPTNERSEPTIWHDAIQRWTQQGRTVKDVSIALVAGLAPRHPFKLAMVVDSGGKSLHSWFAVKDYEPEALRAFREDAASIGADTRMFLPEQWSRFPGGKRSNGADQPVIYFNPAACPSREVRYGEE